MQPLHVRIAFPTRKEQTHRIALCGTQGFTVLSVGNESIVHRLRKRNAALHAAGIGAFRDHPTGARLDTDFFEQERQGNPRPFAATDEAETTLNVGPGGCRPLRSAVAAALQYHDARYRRQPLDVGHRQGERPVHHAVNDQPMLGRIDEWNPGVMPLVVQ